MSTGATIAVVTLSALSFLTSSATLAVVLVGGKRAEKQIDEVRTKTNRALTGFRNALSDLEI